MTDSPTRATTPVIPTIGLVPTLANAESAPAWRERLVECLVLTNYHNTLYQHSAPQGWKWTKPGYEEVSWDQQQKLALLLIIPTIGKEHLKNLPSQKETIAAAWARLNDKFKPTQAEIATYYRLPALERDFNAQEAGNHLSLFDQRFILLSACGVKLTDDMKVGMFVASLPVDWDTDFLKRKRTWPEYRRRFEAMTAPHRLGKKKGEQLSNGQAEAEPRRAAFPATQPEKTTPAAGSRMEERKQQEAQQPSLSEHARPIRQPRPPPTAKPEGNNLLRAQPSHSKLKKAAQSNSEASGDLEGSSPLNRRVSTSRSQPKRQHAPANKPKDSAPPKAAAAATHPSTANSKFSQSNPFDVLGDLDDASDIAIPAASSSRPNARAVWTSGPAEAGPSRQRKVSTSRASDGGRSSRASNVDQLSTGVQDLSLDFCTHCHVAGHDVSKCYHKRTWCSHCQIPGHHVSKCRRKAMGAPKRRRGKGEKRETIVEEDDEDEAPEVLVDGEHVSLINPRDLAEACDSEEGPFWIEAMELEKARLKNHGVFEDSTLPAGQDAGSTSWVYSRQIKRDWAKYRCRVISHDEERTDAAAMGSIPALRVVLAYGASLGMRFRHLSVDMVVALPEPVYVNAPDSTGVWKVNKMLRGMKGSGKAMDRAIRDCLLACDFKKCKEGGVFVLPSPQGRPRAIVFQYGDELLVGSWTAGLKTIVPVIKAKFRNLGSAIDDLGDPALFMGIGIECFPHNCDILLQQNHYVDHVLAGVPELEGWADRTVPLAPGAIDELAAAAPETANPVDRKWWRKVLGQLSWLARCTRPDIAFAVAYLSRFSSLTTLGEVHRAAIMNLLAYLRARREFEFKLGDDEDADEPHCTRAYSHGFVSPALEKSHIGWALQLDGSTVDWASHKSSVAATGLEADLVAQGEAAHRLTWLHDLLTELGVVVSPQGILFGDNCGVVSNQSALVDVFKNNKHVRAEYQFLFDLESKDRLILQGCDDDQPAKMCSMPVTGAEFNRYRLMYGLERQLDLTEVEMMKLKSDEEALHHLLWEDDGEGDGQGEGDDLHGGPVHRETALTAVVHHL